MLKKILFTTSILITSLQLIGQITISSNQKAQFDKLFEPWQGKEVPGAAMAITHKDKTIYQSAAGLADLESKERIDFNTKFQLSVLSQQFVVFGILLLEEEGKIDLNSDIRTILKDFKKFEHTITVNHLLSSTSGLNDFWSLKYLGGWRTGDVINQKDILDFISNQENLAFKPGTEFELSYTDISVITMIIENVSGKTLNEYLDQKVFQPLGMNNSSFEVDNKAALTNLAKPYIKREEKFERNDMQFEVKGVLNLFSTINDMTKWYRNFHAQDIGGKSAIRKLNSYAQLDNGSTYNQSRGTLTLGRGYEHPERGISKIYQNGRTGAYTISVYNFAPESLIGFVFSNGSEDYNGHLAMIALSNILEDKFTLPSTTDFSKMKTLQLTSEELSKYCGHYWSDELSLSREILIEDDTLRYSRGSYSSPLVPIGEDHFQMKMQSDDLIYVRFENKKGKKSFVFNTPSSDPSTSELYDFKKLPSEELESYVGAYVNVSNGMVYKVKSEGEKLVLVNPDHESIVMTYVMGDKFQAGAWYIDQVNFEKSPDGKIGSLLMRGPGFGDISFVRINNIGTVVK